MILLMILAFLTAWAPYALLCTLRLTGMNYPDYAVGVAMMAAKMGAWMDTIVFILLNPSVSYARAKRATFGLKHFSNHSFVEPFCQIGWGGWLNVFLSILAPKNPRKSANCAWKKWRKEVIRFLMHVINMQELQGIKDHQSFSSSSYVLRNPWSKMYTQPRNFHKSSFIAQLLWLIM